MAETGPRRMFRYVVPVDDREHLIVLTGHPVAVAAAGDSAVEFWAEHDPAGGRTDWTFRVFGTGHPLPDSAFYVGTCPRTASGLVWHLYEVSGTAL